MPIIRFFAVIVASVVFSNPVHADNWPQFRGPGGQGDSPEKNLPLKWSATENVAWKTPIAGWGWSSPIVWGDRVFMTATSDDGISCHVICVERKAGKVLWDNEVFKQKPTRLQQKNSYATPTPVTDGTLVYAVFMEGGIAALTFDGKIAWTNFDYPFYNQHGMGTSPIIYKDLLIIPYDTSATTGDLKIGWQKAWGQSYVLALDKTTGKQRWKAGRGQSRIGHCMPRIAAIGGQTQLISGAGDVLEGFDPETGRLIWSVSNIGETVVPTPVLGDGMIFTESGFMDLAIRAWRPGEKGEMTQSSMVWEFKKAVPTIPSYAFHDHRLYTIKEDGMLQCFQAATGALLWKQRLDGHYDASPVVADGKIYLLSEEGTTTVIDAGSEFQVLASNDLNEKCQASIAVSDGQMFIRTREHLFCIRKGP